MRHIVGRFLGGCSTVGGFYYEVEARRWEAAVMIENEVEEVRIEGRVDTLQRAMQSVESGEHSPYFGK